MTSRNKAFTLVEILIVIVILTLLSGIIYSAFMPARERARQAICISNLHQIWAATQMYRGDYGGIEAVKGQPSSCIELGLPCDDPTKLTKTYIPSREVLFCPDFHGSYPMYNEGPEQMTSTYIWHMTSNDDNRPDRYKFSSKVAKDGDEIPIVVDVNHNPPFTTTEPRWTRQTVLFVRLNGQVVTKKLPVGVLPSDGW